MVLAVSITWLIKWYNWVHSRKWNSRINVGVGLLTIPIRDGKIASSLGPWAKMNALSFTFNLTALANNLIRGGSAPYGGGEVGWNWNTLSFNSTGGWFNSWSGWTGAYAVLGTSNISQLQFDHEVSHIWQSRTMGNKFIPLWGIFSLYSKLNGHPWVNTNNGSINPIELQADEGL